MSYIYPEASTDVPYTGAFRCLPVTAPGFIIFFASSGQDSWGYYQYDNTDNVYCYTFVVSGQQYWAASADVSVKIGVYNGRTGRLDGSYYYNQFHTAQYDDATGIYYALAGPVNSIYLSSGSNANFFYTSLRDALDACADNRPPTDRSYTVVFNANGGYGTMLDQTIEVDTPTALNENTFTKENYMFMGWSTSQGGAVVYADEEEVLNLAEVGESITLYAVWQESPLQIIIQRNQSEKNRVDKTIDNVITLSGSLRAETSVIDPIIMISGNVEDVVTCNYMTIPRFGRSYFITNIRSVRTGLYEISAHVDALSSFKTQIRENTAIIHKQEYNWNLYLNDGTFKVFSDSIVETYTFPTGFSGNFEYILAVAGSQSQV